MVLCDLKTLEASLRNASALEWSLFIDAVQGQVRLLQKVRRGSANLG
jgi:hypothetical protein